MTDETVTLDAETAARIRDKVESGEFESAAEAVRAALDYYDMGGWSDEEIRRMVEEADADAETFTVDEVRAFLNEECEKIIAKFEK